MGKRQEEVVARRRELLGARCPGGVTLLSDAERDDWQARWRAAYRPGGKEAFGRGKLRGYDWHVFSHQFLASVEGKAALAAYLAQQPREALIALASASERDYGPQPSFKLGLGPGGALPDLKGLRLDYLVFPPGEAHQIINNGSEDLIYIVIADQPQADVIRYPDSGKWLVKPQRKCFEMTETDYFKGEE